MQLFRRQPPFAEATYWALDLETTGLDPRVDQVLSIGMVPIRGGAIRWRERWYREVRPPQLDAAWTPAIAVHRQLPGELSGADRLADVLPEVMARLDGAALVVHWARLDVELLRRGCRDAGLPWPRPRVVDTLDLITRYARRRRLYEPGSQPVPTQLAEARAFFGLPRHDEHHALYDALATAELLLVLRARLELRRL
ncbi:MAG: 3'-5' exonuclease [Acidobacteriota bacterium]